MNCANKTNSPTMATDPTPTPPGRDALRSPDLALPTVLLAATTFSLWGAVGWLAAQGVLPLWVACFANSILAYVSFTPQHDAVHGSVSRAHPWLNGLVGRTCNSRCSRRSPPFAGCIWRTTSTRTTHPRPRLRSAEDRGPASTSLDDPRVRHWVAAPRRQGNGQGPKT